MQKDKSHFIGRFVTETKVGSEYYEQIEPFGFYSAKFKTKFWMPQGFIHDKESVPIIKGSNDRGGGFHDLVCRKDEEHGLTKQQAATLYLEVQKCRDDILRLRELERCNGFRDEVGLKFRVEWRRFVRNFKTLVVRIAWGYFHKFRVLATLEEICR